MPVSHISEDMLQNSGIGSPGEAENFDILQIWKTVKKQSTDPSKFNIICSCLCQNSPNKPLKIWVSTKIRQVELEWKSMNHMKTGEWCYCDIRGTWTGLSNCCVIKISIMHLTNHKIIKPKYKIDAFEMLIFTFFAVLSTDCFALQSPSCTQTTKTFKNQIIQIQLSYSQSCTPSRISS